MNCSYVLCPLCSVPMSCASECAQDVQLYFSLSVHVVRVLLERHASVTCYSKDCGKWAFWAGKTGIGYAHPEHPYYML